MYFFASPKLTTAVAAMASVQDLCGVCFVCEYILTDSYS